MQPGLRPGPIALILAVVLITVTTFQNCGFANFNSNDTPPDTQYSAGNGDSYTGKPYINEDILCNDDDVAGRLFVAFDGSGGLLTRDNCVTLSPPQPIAASEIVHVPATDSVIFRARSFVSEDTAGSSPSPAPTPTPGPVPAPAPAPVPAPVPAPNPFTGGGNVPLNPPKGPVPAPSPAPITDTILPSGGRGPGTP